MSADWIKAEPVSVIKEDLEDDRCHTVADDVLHDTAAIKMRKVLIMKLFPTVKKETAVKEEAGDLQHPTVIRMEPLPLQELLKTETVVKVEGGDSQDQGEEIVLKEEHLDVFNDLVEKSEFEEEKGESNFPDRSIPEKFHHTEYRFSTPSVIYSSQSARRQTQLPVTGIVLKKKSLQRSKLKKQSTTNGNIDRFDCVVCSKIFTKKCSLNKHIARQHRKSLVCNLCSKLFTERNLLCNHLAGEHGKTFVCNVCSKGFSRSCSLQNHLMIHANQKPFVCKVCLQAYYRRINLQRHLIHCTGKAFTCDVCSRVFPTNYERNLHLVSHKGENAFERLLCPQSVYRNRELQPRRREHSEMPLCL